MKVIKQTARQQGAVLTVVGREVYVSTGHLPEVVADEQGVPIYQAFSLAVAGDSSRKEVKLRLKLPLLGNHQQINAAVALAAIGSAASAGIRVDLQSIAQGFTSVQWPGRLEVVRREPIVVADGAHNVDSFARLGEAMADLFYGRQAIVVLGVSKDKDIEGIVKQLSRWRDMVLGSVVERVIVTRSQHPRAADTRDVAVDALNVGLTVELRDDVSQAIARAEELATQLNKARPDSTIVLITGSLFVVAEARECYGLSPDLSEELVGATRRLGD
jgi:dihydrofolate synthase/folylpolyglutamate synthase